jgi:serine protease
MSPTTALAAVACSALCFGLWADHAPADDPGLDADSLDIDIRDAVAVGAEFDGLLVDFVEPADGEGGSDEAIAALAARHGLELAGPYAEGEHLYRVDGSATALARLEAELESNPLVEGVEPELQYALPLGAISALDGPEPADPSDPEAHKPNRPRVQPNDPMYPLQWHFEAIHVPEAWAHTRGQGAVVAVIDTGVAYKDLSWKGVNAKAVPDLAGIEFVHGQTFLDRALPDGLDDHAHGTHVAGTIAQATDNGIGVAGVAHKAAIMPLKVLGGDGRGSVAAIGNAIRWAADHDADVINMSLGGPLPSSVMSKAIAYAHSKGVTVICAAGNEKKSRVSYPAAYKHSVAVAATNWEGSRSFYSNWGTKLDISAPGGDTRADKNGDGHPDGVLQNTIRVQDPAHNDYLWFQGTSMAAPHAAGVAALVVAQGVTNPDEVERVLKETSHHPRGEDVKWDKDYGAGIIDAEQAVIAAKQAYESERGGLAGVLALLAIPGFTSLRRRAVAAGVSRSIVAASSVAGGVALAAGVFAAPAAYGLAGLAGAHGSALFLSALVPFLLVLSAFQFRRARGLLGGLALGWAAMLLHGAVVLPTLLESIPGGAGWDRLWLAGNAIASLFLARRVLRHEAAPESPDQAL